jgi:type II secretory pathway pseudopilin PulG
VHATLPREMPCDPAPTTAAGPARSKLAVRFVVIAGVLVAVGYVVLSVVVVSGVSTPQARRKGGVKQDLRSIFTVAEAIYTDTGRYPESIESMVNFKNADGTPGLAALEKYPKDLWGHDYIYAITSKGWPLVACLGSDGRPGGEGDAADALLTGGEDAQ